MRYFKEYEDGELIPVSKREALETVLCNYKDNDMARDMLTIPNRILTKYCTIHVKSDDGMIAMAGLYNLLPEDAEYTPEGKRRKNVRR